MCISYTCITCFKIHVLHVLKYMYNTCVYPTQCTTCINMYITHVSATHVIHMYFYTCNIPKTPHMYYRCSTTAHISKNSIHERKKEKNYSWIFLSLALPFNHTYKENLVWKLWIIYHNNISLFKLILFLKTLLSFKIHICPVGYGPQGSYCCGLVHTYTCTTKQ